ncbi:MAG TPA: serine hydrolase [Chitinophagales bacterium]|nr:serine hydrolase [Chitinophagales bacterium]
MKKIYAFLLLLMAVGANGQSFYFPPTSGTAWDTMAPSDLGWCQPRIDSLYNYLQATHASGFIILKDGKIVLEKYFGTFTQDSIHQWASAGKSLTSTLTCIAQQRGLFHINDTVSNILGDGWTSCDTMQERQITIRHLLTMTSGLNDNPTGGCANTDVTPACLQYLVPPYTRWAYHTGAYRKQEDVIATAAGVSYNSFTRNLLGNLIGMNGLWVNYEYYSVVRDAARFGLFILAHGVWANDTILTDTAYYNAMRNTSQNFNLSYGYLWWLNGKATYMAPGLQTVFTGPLVANAPADMFAALGKNDQKIYIVPSQNMVVVRMGNSAYGVADAFSPFDNELWGYIDSLGCTETSVPENTGYENNISIYPNPTNSKITITSSLPVTRISITNMLGKEVFGAKEHTGPVDLSNFAAGVYFITIETNNGRMVRKIIRE